MNKDELRLFRERAENDTGFLCRYVLGWNTDEKADGTKTQGGVRAEGPHQQMVEFLDKPGRYKLLLCSRGAYKSTIVQGLCTRTVLKNPNARILFGMDLYSESLKALGAIREQLENNERIREVWGDLRGSPWQDEKFTVATRTRLGEKNPTFSGFGTDKGLSGRRGDLIVWDDPISWQTVRNPEMIEKSLTALRHLEPLCHEGGTILIVMTPYAHGDVADFIRKNLADKFDILELDCGMTPVPDETKPRGWGLTGTPRFPHLTEERLQHALDIYGPADFWAQYCLQVQNPADQVFFREQFTPATVHESQFQDVATYVLTDTATTTKEANCMSAIIFVALDPDDIAWVLDVRCGWWKTNTFTETLADRLAYWMPRTRVQGVLMENVSLNQAFREPMLAELRGRGLGGVNIIDVPRGSGVESKQRRISGLAQRFASKRIRFCSTIPRTFQHHGKQIPLWEPEGWKDKEGIGWPNGELVEQFIRFRPEGQASLIDIADAMADLDMTDSQGRRYCHRSALPRNQYRPGKPNLRALPPTKRRDDDNPFTGLRRALGL